MSRNFLQLHYGPDNIDNYVDVDEIMYVGQYEFNPRNRTIVILYSGLKLYASESPRDIARAIAQTGNEVLKLDTAAIEPES